MPPHQDQSPDSHHQQTWWLKEGRVCSQPQQARGGNKTALPHLLPTAPRHQGQIQHINRVPTLIGTLTFYRQGQYPQALISAGRNQLAQQSIF